MHNQSYEKQIIFEKKGMGGWVHLNRPRALNALNHDMLESLSKQLKEWADAPDIEFVVIEGEGRAFCAGGDIRMLSDAYFAGKPEVAEQWLHSEYDLNLFIHNYNKPYIAILDGVTMGGGMGISVHGSHRIVTENTQMAMPETAIGFYPDVGARWFLNRAPGKIGHYLALTSLSVGPEDALYCGFGTHYIKHKNIAAMKNELVRVEGDRIDMILDHYRETIIPKGGLKEKRPLIDELFSQSSIEDVFKALSKHPSDFAKETIEILLKRSPRSLRITFEIMNSSKDLSIEEIIEDDKRVCTKFTRHPEFIEGVRATVIDKDRSPKWPSQPIIYE